ncbi:MAG: hypothetical protein EOO52_15525 [Gammaproteobacteria bacterium]|nr:MAG: hypothetical protein EOO52_15525 [Gammaproteobacteria bacterium]
MDKDNLNIQSILSSLTAETLQSARAETFQQLTSALCLTLVGLFLAIIGLLGLTVKLGRLVKCSLLFAAYPITVLFAHKKINAKVAMRIAHK